MATLGIIVGMTTKPAWVAAVAIVVLAAALGGGIGTRMARRGTGRP